MSVKSGLGPSGSFSSYRSSPVDGLYGREGDESFGSTYVEVDEVSRRGYLRK